MRKKYKIILVIIAVLVFIISAVSVYMMFFRKTNKEINKSNVVHSIKNYDYTLDDRDTEIMKSEFSNLEKLLKEEEIDDLEYAKSVSKLFIIDLLTINNKVNKYDIGGLEYLLDSEKDKFKNIIMDSIYANVLDNSNHARNQKLPEVKNVSVDNVTEGEYLKGEESVTSYEVSLSIEYVVDLGYDKNVLVTLIKDDNKLCVVEYNAEIKEAEGEVE